MTTAYQEAYPDGYKMICVVILGILCPHLKLFTQVSDKTQSYHLLCFFDVQDTQLLPPEVELQFDADDYHNFVQSSNLQESFPHFIEQHQFTPNV